MITFGSLFAGIGGFDLGFTRAGMVGRWVVEIDPRCREVLAKHFPEAKQYEDVRHVGKHNLEAVDVICGGFPCQDLSVAGKRAGLAGERSGLWFEYHRILSELKPRWVVIENVPGLLSSNRGRDFAALLSGLAELGYLTTWRVLDAQYFGVPQRRRRVFLVASLGDGRCAEVLFERESLPGDTPPSREAGQGTAGTLDGKSASSCRGSQANETEFIVPAPVYCMASTQANAEIVSDGSPSLTQLHEAPVIAFSSKDNGRDAVEGVAPTLRSMGYDKSHINGGGQVAIAFQQNQRDEVRDLHDVAGALTSQPGMKQQNYIAWNDDVTSGRIRSIDGAGATLQSGGGGQGAKTGLYHTGVGVRRLTPTECARLQGFPDEWNGWLADSTRYRQFGNAVCVNVAEWIARRIVEASR